MEWQTRRWISLLDMVRYGIRDLHALLVWVDRWANWTYSQEQNRSLSQNEQRAFCQQMSCLAKHCTLLELPDTRTACDAARERVNHLNLSEARGHLISIREMLTKALDQRIFMYVPLEYKKFAPPMSKADSSKSLDFFMPAHLSTYSMGSAKKTFPEAGYDIEQLAICMLSEVSTAAVFHAMRIVEVGIRVIGKELGFRKMKEVTKHGEIRWIPIEFLVWEKIRSQLQPRIEKKLQRLRPGPAKQAKQDFYGGIMHDFVQFKDAWRNHVMHTRKSYTPDQAKAIIAYVERFMAAVAAHQ